MCRGSDERTLLRLLLHTWKQAGRQLLLPLPIAFPKVIHPSHSWSQDSFGVYH